jgi:hypothetical protein
MVSYELLTGRHPFDYHAVDAARLPAVEPAPLTGLSRSQRKALQRAFSPDQGSRQKNAGEFLKEFEASNNRRTVVQATVAGALALPLAAFIATQSFGPATDVAFEDLAPEVQQEFERTIQEGQTALSFGAAAINDALQYFSRAYELHPNNGQAVRGLEAVADRLLASIAAADTSTQAEAFGVLYCSDYLGRYAPVTNACNDLLGSVRCASIAASCVASPAD